MAKTYKTGLIITGDSKGGVRAIRATEKELGKLNKGFNRGSSSARRFQRSAGGTAQELALLRRAAAPLTGIIAGMFAAGTLKGQIDFADQLQKTNLRIGASTEALSEYNYVAKLSGVAFSELSTSWQRQTRRIGEAAKGTGEARQALDDLNLSAGELSRLAPEDQFERIASAMQGVTNESEQTALAQKIWGREGVSLLQIVNQGTDAIAQMRAEANSLGLTISQDTAEAMAGFNDEVTRLQAVGTGLSRQILSELVPAMTDGLQAANEFIAEVGGAEQVLKKTGDTITLLATVYLARRLRGSLITVGNQGLATGRNIAAGMVMATGATGPLNQALVVTQGRIAATAAAARGFNVALGAIGGPLGAAMIAAGAVYYFRDELGLTRSEIGLTESQLRDLRSELAEMSNDDLGQSLESLNAALEEATLKAAAAREQLAKLRSEDRGSGTLGFGAGQIGEEVRGMQALADAKADIAEIEDKITASRGEQAKRIKENALAFVEGSDEATEAARHQSSAFESLKSSLDPAYKRTVEYTEAMKTLSKELADGNITQEEFIRLKGLAEKRLNDVAGATKRASAATREAAQAIIKQRDAYLRLRDTLYPMQASQRKFAEEKALLDQHLIEGTDAHTDAVERLHQAYQSTQTVAEAYATDALDDTRGLASAADELGMTFSSAFEDAVIGGNKFRDVLTGIAEDIARIAIRKSVTEPAAAAISAGFGSLFGGSSISGGWTSQVDTGAMFASGGYTGDGAKDQPAGIVHAGEFVVKKSVVDRPGVRPMLERLNSVPGYAAGGYVGGGGGAGPEFGGTTVQIIDQRSGGEEPLVQETRGADGMRWIRVLIRDEQKAALSDGSLDGTMSRYYGLRRRSL